MQPPQHPSADTRLCSKLRKIQSNKEQLERKIHEYERKLKRDRPMQTFQTNENACLSLLS